MKSAVTKKAHEMNAMGNEDVRDIIQYICDYNRLILTSEDFAKRKRIKNVVPQLERCCAKRASGSQCTRRKQPSIEYCGTHSKGSPHGTMSSADDQSTNGNGSAEDTIEVWLQSIKGIMSYIDKKGNVYKAEDVVSNKKCAAVIGRYEIKNGEYAIVSYGAPYEVSHSSV